MNAAQVISFCAALAAGEVPVPGWGGAGVEIGALSMLGAAMTWLLRYYIPRKDAETDAQRVAAEGRYQASIQNLAERHERALSAVVAEFASTRKSFDDHMEKKETQLVEILQRLVDLRGGPHAGQ